MWVAARHGPDALFDEFQRSFPFDQRCFQLAADRAWARHRRGKTLTADELAK
jgi:hypothetical protein